MGRVRKNLIAVLLSLAAMGEGGPSFAQSDPAIIRGLQALRPRAAGERIGESALIGLALIKSEVPANDPALASCVNKVRSRFGTEGYKPDRTGGHDIYEAGVVAMLLANLEASTRTAELNLIAQYLIGRQNANGSWDYTNRNKGDTSISQYAVLGLWEAEGAGAKVPPQVWDRAAQWYLSVQEPEGSWKYHPDEPSHTQTVAMAAAGAGSLLICQRQLARHRRPADAPSTLLVPLAPEGSSGIYEAQTASARIDQAVRRAFGWISANFSTSNTTVIGMSPYYALYGIERLGALADRNTLGRINWFDQGRKYILANQSGDGSWNAQFDVSANTVWAILFLTKSTAKSLKRIEVKRLGAGTLLGGRGLPKDLSSMTIAAGRVVSRPMNGAVEGMLAVLEDPRSQTADSALSGLVDRYETQGPGVLRPHKDRFRRLLSDRDPGLRGVGAWALGRTGDLDVVPSLIGALTDPDEDVVASARLSLELLSRKIKGLGPPSPSTAEQRSEAARRWREWYETIRPLSLEGQDDKVPQAPRAGTPAGGTR